MIGPVIAAAVLSTAYLGVGEGLLVTACFALLAWITR